MRGNEFLEKLTPIDDVLIERAQMASPVRAYFKWIAVAACAAVVFSVGFFGWRHTRLPLLTIETGRFEAAGFEGYMACDIDEIITANPWTAADRITHLPVMRNTLRSPNGQQTEMVSRMKDLLMDTAVCLGMDTAVLTISDSSSAQEGPRFFVENDLYKVEVDATLSAIVEHKAFTLPADCFLHDSRGIYRIAEYLLKEYGAYIHMADPQVDLSEAESLSIISFFEGSSDPVQRLLNYHFTYVKFFFFEDGKVVSRQYQADLSDILGQYPIVTAEQALDLLSSGYFITSVTQDTFPGTAYVRRTELVYRNDISETLYIPYYKFYVELPGWNDRLESGLHMYGVYYVPAVEKKYIRNMPVWDGSLPG